MTKYKTLMMRDIRLMVGRGSGLLSIVFFFFVLVTLFPFALSGDVDVIQKSAGGILWTAGLLASLLSLETIYTRDFDDGTFDGLMMGGVSLPTALFFKTLSHWILSGGVLTLSLIVAGQMVFVPVDVLPVLMVSFALGTFYISLIGCMGAVLTFGAKRPALLMAVLILPLFVPMLILGMMTMDLVMTGGRFYPPLLLQGALALLFLPIAPFLSGQFLKAHLRS